MNSIMFETKDGKETEENAIQPTNSSEPNYFRDFTFHSNMYKISKNTEIDSDQKVPKIVGNLKVRRVAK